MMPSPDTLFTDEEVSDRPLGVADAGGLLDYDVRKNLEY